MLKEEENSGFHTAQFTFCHLIFISSLQLLFAVRMIEFFDWHGTLKQPTALRRNKDGNEEKNTEKGQSIVGKETKAS